MIDLSCCCFFFFKKKNPNASILYILSEDTQSLPGGKCFLQHSYQRDPSPSLDPR
jgi:hypothetical protein